MTAGSGAPATHAPAQAFTLYMLGIASFCALDAVLKHLGESEHPLTVSFGRYVFGFLFALLLWLRAGRPRLTAEIWRAHALRGVVIATTSVTFIWSLTILPFADAITFFFVGPLIIPLLAAALLNEKLRGRDVLAGVIGFGGAAIALSGGATTASAGQSPELYAWGVAAISLSVLTYALAAVLLRGRAARDGSAVVAFMSALIPGLIVAGPAFAVGSLPALDLLPFYALTGLFGFVGLWLVTEAFARAEAQQLAPFEFTALPWAALYGDVFFSEIPRPQLWAGAAIIVAACLWSGWANTRAAKAVAPVATPT